MVIHAEQQAFGLPTGGRPGGSGSDYSGSLCANYCDAKDPACSEACLGFRAAGPLFR